MGAMPPFGLRCDRNIARSYSAKSRSYTTTIRRSDEIVQIFLQHAFRMLVYAVLSTMLLSTFLMNWSFLDGTGWNSLKSALDGTSHQPVVYRRLMPETVNVLRAALSPAAKETLSETIAPQFYRFYTRPLTEAYEPLIPSITKQASVEWQDPEYRVSFVLMYYLCWLFLFLSLFVMRQIASDFVRDARAPLIGVRECAPVFALLCLPLTFLNGGYFYDFGEYFFLALAVYGSLSGKFVIVVIALVLAIANKETAWVFPIFLLPLWHQKWGMRQTVIRAILAVALMLAVFLAIKSRYASNPGAAFALVLDQNIAFWTRPANWWALGDHIGRGFFMPRLMLLMVLAGGLVYGWKFAPRYISMAATTALLGASSLLLLFGFKDELRNLSLAFPLFYAFIVSACVEDMRSNAVWRRA
jgi:hypothetical protein